MHAVVVTVSIDNYESARKQLLERVIPNVKQAPGFVGGYWLAPSDGTGLSVVAFESEENANGMAAQLRGGGLPLPDGVTVKSVEVREVAGSA